METKIIRRTNLKQLLETSGLSQAAFAERCGLAPSVISQLVNGHRNLGDAISRRIEESFSVRKGWLDVPHNENSNDTDYTDRLFLGLDEKRLIELFRQLPDSEKVLTINNLEAKVTHFNRLFEEMIKARTSQPR